MTRAAFRRGMCARRTSSLHHARKRLAWLLPGINPSPPGANAMSKCRFTASVSSEETSIIPYTGWPRKNATPAITNLKEIRD